MSGHNFGPLFPPISYESTDVMVWGEKKMGRCEISGISSALGIQAHRPKQECVCLRMVFGPSMGGPAEWAGRVASPL